MKARIGAVMDLARYARPFLAEQNNVVMANAEIRVGLVAFRGRQHQAACNGAPCGGGTP